MKYLPSSAPLLPPSRQALNLIPLRGFSWATCLLAAIFSSVFLLKALGPTVMDKAPQYAVPFLGAILYVTYRTQYLP